MKDTGKAKKGANTRVVKEKTSKVVDKDIKKRKAVVKDAKPKKQRKSKKATKAAKDPNQPKRPPTAFFIFLSDEFRKSFKEDHPEAKGVAVVGKAGGEKWKDMSEFEKAPYIAKAQQKKQEYDKSMSAYNKQKQDDEEDDEGTPEESDKSKQSEINDDDEEASEEEDDDMDD